ncbi:type I restriction enzyme EcoKI subunit R [Rubripirellula amarantea]|uniref:Type I restriction enzyme EcoKI subunit R n=1 Tax=Rubripirellula amarantea TaxID=2527999 RepID=A0A5C5WKE2_9BACT|nr:DEAD/DEAH box helicase [Rubripirellula amarantea]TWT51067.1 type I restriction enzyme EcoKI subunit R [Rubripirellula amarantea]
MKLRNYQQSAVDAVYDHLRNRDDNPVAVLPTGAGKSLVLAKIASDAVGQWSGRVLILAHVKELLEQNADKVRRLCPDIKVGLYSAGLKKRDTNTPVLVAGIQSIYKRACDIEPFDLIVVDEAHLISKKGDGMYRQFLADCKVINPNVRVIGLTATPFRLDSGMICSPDHFLNSVCYEIGIKELIRDGYLSPLVSKAGVNRADFSGVHLRGGEFVSDEVERLVGDDALVSAACAEMVELTADRRAVLIFASSVAHGRKVVETLRVKHGIECGFVTGETPADERDELLARFRGDAPTSLLETEPLRFLCNVNVLTTGFDAPRVDCVVMLRPTMSPGLLYQCVGRGFRLHPDKQNCLVLDFGGNIERHGPIDQIKPKDKSKRPDQGPPAKECEKCHALVACGYADCPQCGHPFPPPEREPHEAQASEAGVLSGEVTDTDYDVQDIIYRIHRKRDADEDAPRCLRVDYMIGLDHWQSEFICIEHSGYARRKAEAWWSERCLDPCPTEVEEALDIAVAGLLAMTNSVTVRSVSGQRYDRIIKQKLAEIPNSSLEEAPF